MVHTNTAKITYLTCKQTSSRGRVCGHTAYSTDVGEMDIVCEGEHTKLNISQRKHFVQHEYRLLLHLFLVHDQMVLF